MNGWGRWRIGLALILLATSVRLCWTLAVPTIPVGDFATYRESAIYLAEFGHLDRGFVYMPGLVLLLAALHRAGGDVLAAKLLGVAFGGLAAGPVYVIAARLLVNGQRGRAGQSSPRRSVVAPAVGQEGDEDAAPWGQAAPLVAGLAYALWPAGIAMSSVIGTDIPTAALILTALALLCGWGPRRPLLAAVGFGVTMGMAAYFRAVALPLTVLSAAYWLAVRAGWRATVTRTALAVAMTVLMLLPWGLRNRRQDGEFYLTDSHGGITALMGNDPNTEGTHSRSLGALFQQLTGRTFLMEPHRVTDRVAYALARQWMTFDLKWTAGMIALRVERLLAPERGLLYWPIYRPGVIPPGNAAWFNQHRRVITAVTDLFYVLMILGVVAGIAFSVAERRWTPLVPLPFAIVQAATYALFVAEPRYRVTSEVLLFPLFGFGAARLVTGLGALLRSRFSFSAPSPSPPSPPPSPPCIRAALLYALLGLALLTAASVAVVRGGASLRARHRWAVTVWRVDGQPRLAMWRAGSLEGNSSSPVRGTSPGAALTLLPDQHEVSAEIVFPPGALAVGRMRIDARLTWRGAATAPGVILTLGGISIGAGTERLSAVIEAAAGQPPYLRARLIAPSVPIPEPLEVMVTDVTLTSVGSAPGAAQ